MHRQAEMLFAVQFTIFTRWLFSHRMVSSNALIKRIMSNCCIPDCKSYKGRKFDKSRLIGG